MADIKVSLHILVPGARMYSKQQCFKNCETETDAIPGMTTQHNLRVMHTDKKTKKQYPKVYSFHTRNCKPAKQTVNLCQEAYDFMTSDFMPEWFRVPGQNPKNIWSQLHPEDRLRLHLERTAEHFGGTLESFEVLDD